MPSMWMPGAKIMKAPSDGGAMYGGGLKVVWHTTENDPNRTSAYNVAKYLQDSGNDVHVVWNPVSGEIIQTIPADRGGKGLKNMSGGVQTNRGGKYVIQIEVVGQAARPFTDGPCKGLGTILKWVESLGIPATWPAGNPKPYPASSGGTRSSSEWGKSGHFGHSQVPENTHGDPGAVNTRKLTAYPNSKPAGDRWLGLTNPPMTGDDVKNVQHALNVAGNNLKEDKIYSQETAGVVKLFQDNRNISERGVGPLTWAALRKVVHG